MDKFLQMPFPTFALCTDKHILVVGVGGGGGGGRGRGHSIYKHISGLFKY